MRLAALLLAALALCGCETSAEESAKLEKAAKVRAAHEHLVQKGLQISQPSRYVEVLSASLIDGTEGSAAVVTLHNSSARALRDIPIAIEVRSPSGTRLYSNAIGGVAHSLVSVPLLAPHGDLVWVDDQVKGEVSNASVSARVGEGSAATGSIPSISVEGAHLSEAEAAEGTVLDRSSTAQTELVVFAVARRAGRVVAAGRAVLARVASGQPTHFQLFFIGDASGAQLSFSAPPSDSG